MIDLFQSSDVDVTRGLSHAPRTESGRRILGLESLDGVLGLTIEYAVHGDIELFVILEEILELGDLNAVVGPAILHVSSDERTRTTDADIAAAGRAGACGRASVRSSAIRTSIGTAVIGRRDGRRGGSSYTTSGR